MDAEDVIRKDLKSNRFTEQQHDTVYTEDAVQIAVVKIDRTSANTKMRRYLPVRHPSRKTVQDLPLAWRDTRSPELRARNATPDVIKKRNRNLQGMRQFSDRIGTRCPSSLLPQRNSRRAFLLLPSSRLFQSFEKMFMFDKWYYGNKRVWV